MPLAGVILAGGRSSRMDGRDKALLSLGGATLVARAVRRLGPQVSRLALSANGDAARFGLAGIDVIADADDSRSGPLAGILAGLRWAAALDARPDALVSAAVDTPFFPPDLAARLAGAAARVPGAVAVAASAGARHPTFALWPLAVADALAGYLAQGGRRAGAFIEARPHVAVDFPATGACDPFFNVNTPADLAEAEAILRRTA
ncbi:MAG: molybdenum cofactor guanylyltransferase MobA [Hyphomicrobiales bacterium]|nr:MAG: molybdenum cofactor guanylyltransferase MobA [Hyphomicrobiales bacterium]